MRKIPDILGMTLDEAMALPETEGLAFHIQETMPVKRVGKKEIKDTEQGILRIIRVLPGENEIELMVCRI